MKNCIRRSSFPTGCSTFVQAVLSKALLQVVIRARDGRIIIAMEQSGSVAARHLQEVRERIFKRTTVAFGHANRAKDSHVLLLDARAVVLLVVGQHMRCRTHPS